MRSTRSRQSSRAARWLLAPVVALAFAACSDSLGPNQPQPGELDAVQASQRAEGVYAVLADHPALESMDILESAAIPGMAEPAVTLLRSTLPFDPSGTEQPGLRQRMSRLAVAAPSFAAAEPAVLIPADLLGKTLVWDPDANRYVVDESRTGAPATGFRIILYALDPLTHEPLVDLELGYVDFIDESAPGVEALRIVVVLNGEEVINYRASASVEVLNPAVSFGAEGHITKDGKSVEFDLSQKIYLEEERVEFTYDLTAIADGTTIEFDAVGSGRSATVDLVVMDGVNTFTMHIEIGPDGGLTGSVDLPDPLVDITIGGTVEEPIFTPTVEGTEITEAEEEALHNLFSLVDRLERVVRKLLRPAHRLLNVPLYIFLGH